MAKIDLNTVPSGHLATTNLNDNFTSIEDELNNKVLYRDNPSGEPNQMLNDLDMNSQRILNLSDAKNNGEPVTYRQFLNASGSLEIPTALASNVTYTPAGSGAVTTDVQTKLRESVSVKDFGAVGDGVTDDSAAVQLAVDSGKALYWPEGTYLANNITIDNGDSVVWYANQATIKGTSGQDTVINNGGAMHVSGLIFDTGDSAVYFGDSVTNVFLDIVFIDCTFTGLGIAIQGNATQTATHKFTRFLLSDCKFGSNTSFDILLSTIVISQSIVSDCHFLNGGPEAIAILNASNTYYSFTGNIFRNYTNNLTGGDPDGHFIRCYGEEATITGNVFSDLNITGSTVGSDTEALRPQCNKVVISSNVFHNAGMAEGVCALKGCDDTTVSNNRFSCSDAYNTSAVNSGYYTVAIIADTNCKIIGNTFDNFNGAVVDTQDSVPQEGTIEIINNTFIDCQCDQYSADQVLRLTAQQTTYVIKGNVVKQSEASNKYPVNIIQPDASTFHMSDNVFYCTGYVVESPSASTVIYSSNNFYEGFSRLFGAGSFEFISKDDVIKPVATYTNSQLFGSGQMTAPRMVVDDMMIEVDFASDATTSLNRMILFNPPNDTIFKVYHDLTFKDSAAVTTKNASIHKAEAIYDKNASGTVSKLTTTWVYNEYQTYGPDSITQNDPAIVSGSVAIRRPSMTDFTVNVRGKFGFSYEDVSV